MAKWINNRTQKQLPIGIYTFEISYCFQQSVKGKEKYCIVCQAVDPKWTNYQSIKRWYFPSDRELNLLMSGFRLADNFQSLKNKKILAEVEEGKPGYMNLAKILKLLQVNNSQTQSVDQELGGGPGD